MAHEEGDARKDTTRDQLERRRIRVEEFLEAHDSVAASLEALGTEGLTRNQQILALASLAMNFVPGSRQLILKAFGGTYDHSKTPLDPEKYDIEGPKAIGHWSQMFLLKTKVLGLPNMAYKIGYPASEQPVAYYEALAKKYRGEYEHFRKAYADAGHPDVVPTTMYLIAESPRTRLPAIGMLQSYAGANSFDLFDADERTRLKDALRDPRFAARLDAFREVMLRLVEEGRTPDIIGRGNILVVETEDGPDIRFVDPHELLPLEMLTDDMQEAFDAKVAELKSISL